MEESLEQSMENELNKDNQDIELNRDTQEVGLNRDIQEIELYKDNQDIELNDVKGDELHQTQVPPIRLVKYIKSRMHLPDTDIRTYSPLTLAFIGDVVYDLVIRTMIVEQGNAPVNKLHKRVSNLVKAPAQVELYHKIESILTEEEMAIYKRGRNAKSFTSAKNASITDYRIATGMEALIGYLYLNDQFDRIMELLMHGLTIWE